MSVLMAALAVVACSAGFVWLSAGSDGRAQARWEFRQWRERRRQ